MKKTHEIYFTKLNQYVLAQARLNKAAQKVDEFDAGYPSYQLATNALELRRAWHAFKKAVRP